jgi:hypothetical protein
LLGTYNRAVDWAYAAVAGSRLPREAVVLRRCGSGGGGRVSLTAGPEGVLVGSREFALGAVRSAGLASRAVCRRGENQGDREEQRTGTADRNRWMNGRSHHVRIVARG